MQYKARVELCREVRICLLFIWNWRRVCRERVNLRHFNCSHNETDLSDSLLSDHGPGGS